jgi:YebC/PmpR family DNA-binding regulatory protein
MAGHSKWANIKHRKGKADAQKGKIFTRISKEIINAVKLGGKDPKANPRLRLALQKAKDANVPNDNVERCIKRAESAQEDTYEEMQYEIYGFGGVGIIVDAMSNNRNRISSDIKAVVSKRGGNIAHPGAVSYNFDRKGVIYVEKAKALEDELFKVAVDAGAEDFSQHDDQFIILCDPNELLHVKEAIQKLGFPCKEAGVEMLPKTYVECDVETAKQNLALIGYLEEIDDVDTVFHNLKIPEEALS